MCGIVGLFATGDEPPRAEDVYKMAQTIQHRGPDSDGFFLSSRVALGYRRLAIIDPSGGNQPITNEDGSIVVFQNGEIYNFRQLRAELESKGHTFRTDSDTEAIVHLYEVEGEGFAERLRGMFAIAIFDRRRERLLLVRDRIGEKPLYYAHLPGMLLFASELKAMLALPTFPRAVDEEALLDFFTYRGVLAPKTIFRAARKLPAGHLLVADAGGVRPPRAYWRLSFADPFTDSPKRLADQLRELITESVRAQLVADVPVGAFLSGGVDSSAVVAAMVTAKQGQVRTYCVGFDDPSHDERAASRATAAALGTEHVDAQVPLDPESSLEVLPWYFDEPLADASAVPTYAVSKLARDHVRVALSGDGGDELFAGYRRYVYDRIENQVRHALPTPLRPPLALLAAAYPKGDWLPQKLRARTFLTNVLDDPAGAYFRSVRAGDPSVLLQHFGGDIRARLRGYEPFTVLGDAYARADAPDPLSRVLQTDLAIFLPEIILTKVDRASMAVSLEVRCPMLDHRLVEFAARIPVSLKLRRGRGKWILRRALDGVVPQSVLRSPKRGFDVPLGDWTRHRLRPQIEAAMRDAPPGLFEPKVLATTWREHLSGIADRSDFFWAVLVLDRWRRVHGIPLP
jgi:asparagine synthase (glutamine-hydrolysing)